MYSFEGRSPRSQARTRVAKWLAAALSIGAGAPNGATRPHQHAIATVRSYPTGENFNVGPSLAKRAKAQSTVTAPKRPATTLEVNNCNDHATAASVTQKQAGDNQAGTNVRPVWRAPNAQWTQVTCHGVAHAE